MSVINITKENFEQEVLHSEKPVLLDFYADWCGPCRMVAPTVHEIAEENDHIKVGKINVDQCRDLAVKYNIRTIPTFMIFKDGEVKDVVIGIQSHKALAKAIEAVL